MPGARPDAVSSTPAPAASGLDVERLRRDFPLLGRRVYGRPLVYLDNAATTQKPEAVIDAENGYYREFNSNVHRGVHWLSQEATTAFEEARRTVQRFVGAAASHEIVFVRGTTEAVNLVANAYGRAHVGAGDEVLITWMEHHSNLVPWQMLCEATGATLCVVPIDERGELVMEAFDRLLTDRTRIVAVAHVSNALGTVNPVAEIVRKAHAAGAVVLVDGAQAVHHVPVDVGALDADFYAFSGHKIYGPMGVGVLYGKAALLDAMPPWQGGGDMIHTVTFEKSTWNELPYKFEAGTPNVAGALGLAAALNYLEAVGRERVAAHEASLLTYATAATGEVPGLRFIGTAREKAAVLSFMLDGIHPHDVGTVLDREGIAVRTGHHCAYPVMQHFGVPATTRASLALYNTTDEIDALVAGLGKVHEVFHV
ncbi:MAG: SufS family cysteine desulfurase [Planctomycetota bacterium]|jgi:cysteine desulfurase/selenocysteine lyase